LEVRCRRPAIESQSYRTPAPVVLSELHQTGLLKRSKHLGEFNLVVAQLKLASEFVRVPRSGSEQSERHFFVIHQLQPVFVPQSLHV
jgi:hypothetical protein